MARFFHCSRIIQVSTLKDFVYKPSGPAIDVLYVRPVRDEAAATRELLPLVNGGQAMIRRSLDDVSSLNIEHGIDEHDDSLGAFLHHCRKGGVEVGNFFRLNHLKLYPEGSGRDLRLLQHLFECIFTQRTGLPQDRHSA